MMTHTTHHTGAHDTAVELRDASCAYGDREVLTDVRLSVRRGEFFCVVGPNGAGKTTLLRLAAGLIKPSRGLALLDGEQAHALDPRTRAGIAAYVPQSEQTVFPFTVRAMVLMGRYPHLGGLGYEREEDHQAAARAMKLTEVDDLADRPVTQISGGELHRVAMARALAQDTPLLLLDEANAHLDVRHQLRLFSLLRRLQREEGRTVVFVVHDLNLAALFADRIAVVADGKLRALGTPSEVLTEEHLLAHFGVRASVTAGPETGRPHVMLLPFPDEGRASSAG